MDGRIKVPGALLRYEIIGDGPAIVVLHGGPGIGFDYLEPELAAAFSDRHRLIFYDQRGSGQSTGADDRSQLTIDAFVEDLERVFHVLELPSAILLGHSFGGLLAMHYSIRYSERVKGLILVDSDPASKALWVRFREVVDGRRTDAEAEELAVIQSTTDPSQSARYWELRLRPHFHSATTMPEEFGRRLATTRPENLESTAASVRNSLGDWDVHPLLGRIECPTLLAYGATSVFPEEAFERMHHGIVNSSVAKIEGASHFPSIEAPDAFNRVVGPFLERFRD